MRDPKNEKSKNGTAKPQQTKNANKLLFYTVKQLLTVNLALSDFLSYFCKKTNRSNINIKEEYKFLSYFLNVNILYLFAKIYHSQIGKIIKFFFKQSGKVGDIAVINNISKSFIFQEI